MWIILLVLVILGYLVITRLSTIIDNQGKILLEINKLQVQMNEHRRNERKNE